MTLNTVLARVEGFLHKAERVHKPLQEFKGMSEFSSFKKMMRSAIATQARAIANELPVPDSLGPLTVPQIAKLNQDIAQTMPQLSSLVTEDAVAKTFTLAFVHGVRAFYSRNGIIAKADVSFKLTNEQYKAELQNQASYLLNRSKLDDTTINRLVNLISSGKEGAMTNDEISAQITDEFPDIAEYRADMIARTEVARAMSYGDLAAMQENGVQTKSWVTAGPNPCPICEGNEAQGEIDINAVFDSSDDAPPAHPGCECYSDQGMIDLNSPGLVLWDGS